MRLGRVSPGRLCPRHHRRTAPGRQYHGNRPVRCFVGTPRAFPVWVGLVPTLPLWFWTGTIARDEIGGQDTIQKVLAPQILSIGRPRKEGCMVSYKSADSSRKAPPPVNWRRSFPHWPCFCVNHLPAPFTPFSPPFTPGAGQFPLLRDRLGREY